MEVLAPVGRRPEHAAAARRERPLVQVGRVPVDAQRGDVDVDRAGRMGGVDQHRHAARATRRGHLGERQDQRRLARDVVEQRDPRARRDARSTARTKPRPGRGGNGKAKVASEAPRSLAMCAAARATPP